MDITSDTDDDNSGPLKNLIQNPQKTVLTEQPLHETKNILTRGVDDILKDLPVTSDTECGIGCIHGPILQRLATKTSYLILYGFLTCMYSASAAYFNGTITTIEKRFKIPSRTTGFITIGNFITQLLLGGLVPYFASKGRRPRWIAAGIFTMVFYCFMAMLSHFLYGPGEDALQLTNEYDGNLGGLTIYNSPEMQIREQKSLCLDKLNSTGHCDEYSSDITPQILLFIGRCFYGIGDAMAFTLGMSYMDDNVSKSNTPTLISLSYFIKMIGPALGYALVSFALKIYIAPSLTPTITPGDPRWLGAWWMGWIVFAVIFAICGCIMSLFPKTLPRAAARRIWTYERNQSIANYGSDKKNDQNSIVSDDYDKHDKVVPASWDDLTRTLKRLGKNGALLCNSVATVFFLFGCLPYWLFMPKYIETQFKQSASASSLITGSFALLASGSGFLMSGFLVSKFKPEARFLAGGKVVANFIIISGIITFAYIGCQTNGNEVINKKLDGTLVTKLSCNENCNCDYATYNPVCAEDGRTFISACHAGCRNILISPNGTKEFMNCSCVESKSSNNNMKSYKANNLTMEFERITIGAGSAVPGPCPVDCMDKLYMFLAVSAVIQFASACGAPPSFLISLRCVNEKDKSVAMGFSLMILSLFAFIPAPIVYGIIFDKSCLVWGKTCTGTSNCWMYDSETLRYMLNFTAATFVGIGTILEVGVWYFVKDVKIFDEEDEKAKELKKKKNEKSKIMDRIDYE